MVTNNSVILKNIQKERAIICPQRKAEKIIPTEESIIEANKLAFNDDIGTTTNRISAMIERRDGFEIGSKEYETLNYRILCGQKYQQDCID